MSGIATEPCPHCQRRRVIRFATNGNGRLIELRQPCACETPTLLQPGTQGQRDQRAQRSARRRQLHAERMQDPEYAAAYRQRRQRERSVHNAGYAKLLETDRRLNSDPERQQRKREHSRKRYRDRHPERPDPHCVTCGDRIPYDGRGKPPKYHQTNQCNPHYRQSDHHHEGSL